MKHAPNLSLSSPSSRGPWFRLSVALAALTGCAAPDAPVVEEQGLTSSGRSDGPPRGDVAEAAVIPETPSAPRSSAAAPPPAREDDILRPAGRSIAGSREVTNPWRGGVVPYVIAAAMPAVDRQWVEYAIGHWAQWSGIRFVPRTSQADYVDFQPDPASCSSYVGRIGGRQTITVPYWCERSVIHEIGHAVGLDHEQNRSDRDAFVTIHFGNIDAGAASNFEKMTKPSFGFYDFESVMHYGTTAFSVNGGVTISRVDGAELVTQRQWVSWGDVEGVNALYFDQSLPDPRSATAGQVTRGVELWETMATNAKVVRTLAAGAPVVRSGYEHATYEYVRHEGRWGWVETSALR